jgi:glyoxalase family protein
MRDAIPGIHHITAICSDAQRNIDFYCNVLGLRLVKLTVNFDDPGAYHLYYGDELGRPGSVLTFFAWPGARRGRNGTGQINVTAFSVPADSFSYWQGRLQEHGIETEQTSRFGEAVLSFQDADGMQLELVASAVDERASWRASPISSEYSIRRFSQRGHVRRRLRRTAQLLTIRWASPCRRRKTIAFVMKWATAVPVRCCDVVVHWTRRAARSRWAMFITSPWRVA